MAERLDDRYAGHSLFEVQELRALDVMMDAYKQAFKDRYGEEPYVDDAGKETLKALFRALAKGNPKRIVALIMAYLEMDDDWFLKKAHSLGTLKQDVNRVLAYLGQKKLTQPTNIKIMDEADRFLFYIFNTKGLMDSCGITPHTPDSLLYEGRPISREQVSQALEPLRGQRKSVDEIRSHFKAWLASSQGNEGHASPTAAGAQEDLGPLL